MRLDPPLIEGRLRRRYKRFLADVDVGGAGLVTVYCPNTGAMLGCQEPGARVWLSESDNEKRKHRYTWELVEVDPGVLVGINTARSNALVGEALVAGDIAPLAGYDGCRAEVPVSGARLDFRLSAHPARPDCYVEVKNVTAAVDTGVALFPDAVSRRAVRHLETLAGLVGRGWRAVLVYCVQRGDVERVEPAHAIDPAYASALAEAAAQGVEVYAYRAQVTPDRIRLAQRIDVATGAAGGRRVI